MGWFLLLQGMLAVVCSLPAAGVFDPLRVWFFGTLLLCDFSWLCFLEFFPGISGVQQLLVCLASAGMAGMPQFCGFGSF